MAFRDENTRNSPQSRRYARLVAPIIERIDSGCASISMRVLIRLTAPAAVLSGQEIEKPGWTRLGFSVLMKDDKADHIIRAVDAVARATCLQYA